MRTDMANTFRDTATLFVAEPTLDRREYLTTLCDALSPDEAWQLVTEVCRAYEGMRPTWLEAPQALSILFEVGDLIDRLSDAMDALDVDERKLRRKAAVDRAASERKLHLEHVERLEAERRWRAEVKRRCAVDFEAIRSRNFEDCMGGKSRTVLVATDAYLARQSPVWWADIGIEACSAQVRHALVHRMRQLVARRGSATLPPAMHVTLRDVERRMERDALSNFASPLPTPVPLHRKRRWSWEDASIRPLLRTVWRRVRSSIFRTPSSR